MRLTEGSPWKDWLYRALPAVRHRSTTVHDIGGMDLIHYCRIEGGNFGDDLNIQLWGRLFPNLSSLKGRVIFYGVGTILDGRHDKHVRKVVLGSGIGEAHMALSDPNWDFRWVRGPKTADEFGIAKQFGLGDSAILWPGLQFGHNAHGPIGLVPHYATWDSFDWTDVGAKAGMTVINPRQSPDRVIDEMRSCSRIMAESLHGAICADAMGIPWAACVLAHRFNEFKWRDWLATIERPYQPLMMDRPLVRSIPKVKALANKLARAVNYQRLTRHPHLRPTKAATAQDVLSVARSLRSYGVDRQHFYCSNPLDVARQRQRMLQRCAEFAQDYELEFTP